MRIYGSLVDYCSTLNGHETGDSISQLRNANRFTLTKFIRKEAHGRITFSTLVLKILRIRVDNNSKFSDHIEQIISKARQRIGPLSKCFITRYMNVPRTNPTSLIFHLQLNTLRSSGIQSALNHSLHWSPFRGGISRSAFQSGLINVTSKDVSTYA